MQALHSKNHCPLLIYNYFGAGCVDGTQVAIKAPSEKDPRFNKAAYWCRKQYYAVNAMIVSIDHT